MTTFHMDIHRILPGRRWKLSRLRLSLAGPLSLFILIVLIYYIWLQQGTIQDTRKSEIRGACTALKDSLDLRYHPVTASVIYADDDKKIVYCLPPKTGCTVLKKAIGTASGKYNHDALTEAFKMEKNWFRQELSTRLAFNPSEYVHTEQYLNMIDLKPGINSTLIGREDYFKVVIVRDPYDRLLSAYKDKILSILKPGGEYYGAVPFMLTIQNAMRGQSGNKSFQSLDEFKRAKRHRPHIQNLSTLDEVLRYLGTVVDKSSAPTPERHFTTIYSACRVCDIHYDYIIKQETLHQDIMDLYKNILKYNADMLELLDPVNGPRSTKHGKTKQQYFAELSENAKKGSKIVSGT